MSVVIMYIASVMPAGKLALCAVASGIVCMTVVKSGVKNAVYLYAVVSVLSLLLLPDKTIAMGYLIFLGNYPILKGLIEKRNRLSTEWILKIIVFSIYAVALYMGVTFIFPDTIEFGYSLPVVAVGFLIVASVYDVALSLLITELVRKFSKILNK